MLRITVLALFALCALGVTLEKDEKGISIITRDTFDAAVQEHSNMYVEFYAPWCGACAAFAPVYGFAEAQRAKADLKDVVYAKIDASNKKEPKDVALRQTYGVMGYPTLIHFLDGVPATYTQIGMNEVQANDLTDYAMRFLGGANRPWKELDDVASIEGFFSSEGAKEHAAVGAFFPDLTGHAGERVAQDLAHAVVELGVRVATKRNTGQRCCRPGRQVADADHDTAFCDLHAHALNGHVPHELLSPPHSARSICRAAQLHLAQRVGARWLELVGRLHHTL